MGNGGDEGEVSETLKQEQEQIKPRPQSENTNSNNNNNNNNNNNSNNSRYWMRDLYKYSYPRGYGGASGLYNLAWAQAVQNKPLNDVLVDLETEKKGKTGDDNRAGSENKEEESDMEEGELEEGELEEDGDAADDNVDDGGGGGGGGGGGAGNDGKKNSGNVDVEDGELEIQVSSIRKVLYNVTVSDAHKSFDIVCARLRSSLESLRELVLHTWFPSKDDLIQQSFAALLCVNSVYSSMSPTLRDQNRDKMIRLLSFVISLSSVLFTPDQRKEIEDMITIVNPPPPPPSPPKPKSRDKQEEVAITDNKPILTDSNTLSVNAGDNSSDFSRNVGPDSAVRQTDKQNNNAPSGALKQFPGTLNVRSGGFGPLLDLHKVHDEDSLPSPTSKTTPTLPFFGSAAPPRVVHGSQNPSLRPYETEALKAFSSYQQKFGGRSYMTQDRLPSPTPSEDGNDGGADDFSEEVSSFNTPNNHTNNHNNHKAANPSVVMQPIVSSGGVATSIQATQALASGISAGPSSAVTNPASLGSRKSRDPRLRHLSSNVGSVDLSFCPPLVVSSAPSAPKLEPPVEMNSKKKPEDPQLDSPAPKRQKSDLETTTTFTKVNEVQSMPGSNSRSDTSSALGGLAADPRNFFGTVSSVISTANPSAPVSTMSQQDANVSTTDPLQSLLKGITGNPTALINMFKEQQKFKEPLHNVSQHSTNSISAGMQVSLPTTAPTVVPAVAPTSSGSLQIPSQIPFTSPQKDLSKPRMKPRDPRRALQSIATQKTDNQVSDQQKLNGVRKATNQGGQESLSSQGSGNEANISPSSYTLAPELPDIAKQFTKNLKNIADLITAPLASSVQPLFPTSSLPVTVNLDKESVTSGGPISTLRPGEVVAGRLQSQNHWGDVEHLFEGYDDQQRAAIQQERARRMDEQKKMFDAGKLCLVLDLDHTLLNSAKFAEVDPRHDEILRKKEEHDREQPRRHLFRFPHMGMWTKLRPGIWNFLEKVSKLYELHLYTMGNKLYATEMAKVLDPKGSLFAGRVISRGDDGEPADGDDRAPKSKDLEGVLGMESAVVIIDDSVRVWPHNKLNLIVVERYLYFPCSRRHFGLSGPSLLDCDRDERPEDGTLACCLGVVERIHQNFFANKSLDDLDVRNILASEQRKVLGGCRILFSRVFPVGEANPHLYPLWQTAEQFGAVCTNQIDEQVTHVVANAPGTDKVNWALSTGRFAVYPSWVEASAVLYRRANEQDFAIKP